MPCPLALPGTQHHVDRWRRDSPQQGQEWSRQLGNGLWSSGTLCISVVVKVMGSCPRISQEHGIITSDNPIDYSKYPIGTVLMVYPNHSCMTAAQHAKYYIINGDMVVDNWTPAKFWFSVS